MADTHPLAHDLKALLANLIRAALPANEADADEPRRKAIRLREAVRADLGSQPLAEMNLDGLWTAAMNEAETPDLNRVALRVSQQLPASCPLTAGDLVQPGLALGDLEERIRLSASTG